MATNVNAVGISNVASASNTTSTSNATAAANDSSNPDRFLKLLVAQMQNQDPLNPLDNAQVTSQMAQISTVSGIEKLNRSIGAMGTSFAQMQQMQGAALVGREVMLAGDALTLDANGMAGGGFEIERAADVVTVDILSATGTVLDTIDVGAQSAGRHSFEWALKPGINPQLVANFRVNASYGTLKVDTSPLMRDTVQSVLTGGSQLTLELALAGNVPYSNIKAFH